VADIEFGQPYYKQVIERNGYDPALFDGFSADLQSIGREDLEQIFLCHQGLYEFRDSDKQKAVLTGFGLSGVPHLGTLSQIHRSGLLNRAGYEVEVVLGDLDAYNGKLVPLHETRSLAETYGRFLEASQLLDPRTSHVRNQYDRPEILRAAYLLGRYVSDSLFEKAEEDLHGFYSARGKVDESMTYRRKLSLNLMIADFFHLGQRAPEVLVMLGLDEHQYVRTAQSIGEQVVKDECGLQPVRISSLYTPLIKGLNGYPKMSKSFPDSGITLDMEDDAIEHAVTREKDDYENPSESVIYQIACGIGVREDVKLGDIRAAAEAKGSDWRDIKSLLVGRIATFAGLWKEVSE
jgi:tryptophanyl-tRNA synthetase